MFKCVCTLSKRFIPAGAGNSQYHYIKECRIPVYPRWRGELGTCLIICVATVGLSPLARGTLPLVSCRPRKNRFIPAGAGNSNSYTDKSSKQTVYPRWRGELTNAAHQGVSSSGLSPLARGTRCCLYRTLRESRFIPAGAGNSRARGDSGRACTVYPRWRGELTKHNLLLIIDFLSQSQSTNLTETHKQHIHYVKEHLIH